MSVYDKVKSTSIATIVFGLGESLVVRALASLGFGWISYEGVSTLINTLVGSIDAVPGAMGATFVSIARLASMDVAVNLIISAYLARVTMMGMMSAGKYLTRAGVTS